jgi:ribonuclease BN (tRNA processing enzyme)
MNLLILGCGTIIQYDTSVNCSGYLLDQNLLFDCGPGIWKALNQYRIPPGRINDIFLTHFHVDHTSDLGPLLLNRVLLPSLKDIPLNITGPIGLKGWFSELKNLLGKWADELSINLIEIENESYLRSDHAITVKHTGHTDNSICYRVEKDGNSFFYSGDTGYSDNVITFSADCQLAVIEASNTEKTHIEEHLTPCLAGKIASFANIKKLILTHMYPEVLAGDPLKEASSVFSGEIILAQEGMSIDF